MEHDGCNGCLYESEPETSEHCTGCTQNAVDKYTPMTNADRIRAYNDEDLARFIEGAICNSNGWCDDCPSMRGEWCNGIQENVNEKLLAWLKEKVE